MTRIQAIIAAAALLLSAAAAPAPPSPKEPVRDGWPSYDDAGVRILKHPAQTPPPHHAAVTGDPVLIRDIETRRPLETVANHVYWRVVRDKRYAHAYRRGVHWYGFYNGPTYYWAAYHRGRWWWRDARSDRWVYWWDGFWWWAGPRGPFVYVDDGYYPGRARDPRGALPPPETPSPPPTPVPRL